MLRRVLVPLLALCTALLAFRPSPRPTPDRRRRPRTPSTRRRRRCRPGRRPDPATPGRLVPGAVPGVPGPGPHLAGALPLHLRHRRARRGVRYGAGAADSVDRPGQRPILAYAMGTQGLGDDCAPSYHLRTGTEVEIAFLAQAMLKGYAVALTDYEGLAPRARTPTPSPSPRATHCSTSAARPARSTGPASARRRRLGLRLLPGCQAAAAAGELAPTYAPELPVVGIAEAACRPTWAKSPPTTTATPVSASSPRGRRPRDGVSRPALRHHAQREGP